MLQKYTVGSACGVHADGAVVEGVSEREMRREIRYVDKLNTREEGGEGGGGGLTSTCRRRTARGWI